MTNDETVASVAELFLGNIMYALEKCAVSLSADGKEEDAAFYRSIGRSLAEARGREKQQRGDGRP